MTFSVNYFVPMTKIIVISQNLLELLVCSIYIIRLSNGMAVKVAPEGCRSKLHYLIDSEAET